MSKTVDAFSQEVFGRRGAVTVVQRLPSSPRNYWPEGKVVYSILEGGFYGLYGTKWVRITDLKSVYTGDGSDERPDVTGAVFWVSEALPVNAISGDFWLNLT